MSTKALKDAYIPFRGKLTFNNFVTKINSLPIDKWNFVRGSLLYQQALKCKACNPDIAMVIFSSCADALKVAGKKAGSRKNFKTFYLKHCPSTFRVPPIKYYPNAKPPLAIAPFDKALDFIYAKFRCLYVHEGKGRLQPLPKGVNWIAGLLLDKYDNEYYQIDILKILGWFAKITLESLSDLL